MLYHAIQCYTVGYKLCCHRIVSSVDTGWDMSKETCFSADSDWTEGAFWTAAAAKSIGEYPDAETWGFVEEDSGIGDVWHSLDEDTCSSTSSSSSSSPTWFSSVLPWPPLRTPTDIKPTVTVIRRLIAFLNDGLWLHCKKPLLMYDAFSRRRNCLIIMHQSYCRSNVEIIIGLRVNSRRTHRSNIIS